MSTESTAGTEDIADLSYEEARDELVAIVSRIEGGNASLEESMELWERGEALAAHCQAKLDQAQDQLDRGASAVGGPGEVADGPAVGGPGERADGPAVGSPGAGADGPAASGTGAAGTSTQATGDEVENDDADA